MNNIKNRDEKLNTIQMNEDLLKAINTQINTYNKNNPRDVQVMDGQIIHNSREVSFNSRRYKTKKKLDRKLDVVANIMK